MYLLPNTRHVPQPNNLLSFVPVSHTLCITHKTKLMFLFSFVSKENADIKAAALDLQIPQPVVTVRGNVTEPKDAFLVIEKVVVCQLPIPSIPIALLGSFYVLNMEYTPGCSNIFQFMEVYFLDIQAPSKKTRISNFLAQLNSV